MISETGKNLSILIMTKPNLNWETFATWYSFYKNLPDANVVLFCQRTGDIPFMYFQWAKRLKIPKIDSWPFSQDEPDLINFLSALNLFLEKKIIKTPTLIVKPYTVCTGLIRKELLEKMNNKNIILEENFNFINVDNIKNIINEYYLENREFNVKKDSICFEAKNTDEKAFLLSYNKGCGRWIHKSKGCPFSNARGLMTAEMTSNEKIVIELWDKMAPLFQAVK